MTLCKFYQQGNCKFGNSCRFEHSTGGGSRFGALAGKPSGGSSSSRAAEKYRLTTDAIEADLSSDAPTWILSSYAPGRDAPGQLFGGFPREQSFEEMRLLHLIGAASGNEQQAIQEAQDLYNTAQSQMQTAVKDLQGAVDFVASQDNEHPNRHDICQQGTEGQPFGEFEVGKRPLNQTNNAFASNTNGQTSAFGGGGGGGQTSSAFGQPSNLGQKPNPFGQPSQPTQGSTFGQPSQPGNSGSAFGQPSQLGGGGSAFGQPSSLGAKPNPFGQPSLQTQGSSFGQPSQPGNTGSAFGQPSQPGSTGSAFGQPSQLGSTGSAFGKPSQLGSTGSAFGQPSQPGSTGSAFGQPSQPGPQTSAFGQQSQLGAKPNPFGQPSQPQTSTFGQPSQPGSSGSAFGQPSQPGSGGSAFGQASQLGQKPNPFASTSNGTNSASPFASAANNDSGNNSNASPFASAKPNPFGQPSQTQNASPSPFATTGTSQEQSKPNPFGQPSQPAQQSSAFGQPSQMGAKPSPFATSSQNNTQNAANPFASKAPQQSNSAFGQPSGIGSNGMGQGSAAPVGAAQQPDGAKNNPFPPDSTRTHPSVSSYTSKGMNGQLNSFRDRPVSYKDGLPGIKQPDRPWQRIWFPTGPPTYNKDTALPAGDYDAGIKDAWDRFAETGEFVNGVMPVLPPPRDCTLWNF